MEAIESEPLKDFSGPQSNPKKTQATSSMQTSYTLQEISEVIEKCYNKS